MAQVSNIQLDISPARNNPKPRADVSFDVTFTERELEEDYEYQIRAFLFEQDQNRDEIVFYPNGHSISWAFSADWPTDPANKDDLNEGQGYFGRKIVRPGHDADENGTYEVEFEREFSNRDAMDAGDGYGDPEEYYAVVTVTPEIHSAVAFSSGVVSVDAEQPLL